MEVLAEIPFRLDATALMRSAQVEPDSDDSRDFEALVRRASDVARPKAVYSECFISDRGPATVTIGDTTFSSLTLRTRLDKVERVFAFIATCGREVDSVPLAAGDMLQAYWLDTIKASLLGTAIQHLNEHLSQVYLLGKTAAMSPGSGDVDTWPIGQQRDLFALLGDVKGAIGVELTESCLMIPNKTVSGIRFATETDFRTCQVCHRENCPSRSAPFDRDLWAGIRKG